VQHPNHFNSSRDCVVENQIIPDHETTHTGHQFISLPPDVWRTAQQPKSFGDGIDNPISSLYAVPGDMQPDLI